MAGPSSLSDRDRVLDATDLAALIGEHLALRPKGREMVGLCPFHDDRSPSLAVVTHKGNGFYKCFACGASGNAIDFVMEYLKLDFPSALKMLAARAGVTQSRPPEPANDDDDEDAPYCWWRWREECDADEWVDTSYYERVCTNGTCRNVWRNDGYWADGACTEVWTRRCDDGSQYVYRI